MIEFKIEGIPIPKGRPRFYGGHAVTPKRTRDYEKAARIKLQNEYHGKPIQGPISVDVKFSMPVPESYTKTQKNDIASGALHHTKRPDIDNLLKTILDLCNGVLWDDDSQVIKMNVEKDYGFVPYTKVVVRPICKKESWWF